MPNKHPQDMIRLLNQVLLHLYVTLPSLMISYLTATISRNMTTLPPPLPSETFTFLVPALPRHLAAANSTKILVVFAKKHSYAFIFHRFNTFSAVAKQILQLRRVGVP